MGRRCPRAHVAGETGALEEAFEHPPAFDARRWGSDDGIRYCVTGVLTFTPDCSPLFEFKTPTLGPWIRSPAHGDTRDLHVFPRWWVAGTGLGFSYSATVDDFHNFL